MIASALYSTDRYVLPPRKAWTGDSEMLTAVERAKVLARYHERWGKRMLKQAVSNDPMSFNGPYSVQQFFHDLWATHGPTGALMELRETTTLAEYLRQGMRLLGQVLPLREIALPLLCMWPLDRCIWEALVPIDAAPGEADRVRQLIKRGAVEAMAPEVWDSILDRYGSTPVIDLFRVTRTADGWFEWFPDSFSPNRHESSERVREWSLPTQFGPVTLKLLRNEHCEQVNAYEWEATMIGEGDKVWCRAVGSAYVLKPFTSLSGPDFFLSAETMCEHDAAMVIDLPWWKTGLEQSAVFLWIWERHPSAPKGSGVACVEAALRQLKRSYRSLAELVVDARPRQWAHFGCVFEPAPLRERRTADIERVKARIDFGRLSRALGSRTRISLVYPSLDEHPLGVEARLPQMAAASFGIPI